MKVGSVRLQSACLILGAALLLGCSGGAQETEAVRVRAQTYWDARVDGDWVTAYEYEEISTRPDAMLQQYMANQGSLRYKSVTVKDVALTSAERANVKVEMLYFFPMRGATEPVQAEVDTVWVKQGGEWYSAAPENRS